MFMTNAAAVPMRATNCHYPPKKVTTFPVSIWNPSIAPIWRQSAIDEVNGRASWTKVDVGVVSKSVHDLWRRQPLKRHVKCQLGPARRGPLATIVALSETFEIPPLSWPDQRDEINSNACSGTVARSVPDESIAIEKPDKPSEESPAKSVKTKKSGGPMHPRNTPLKTRGMFSIFIGNVPIGHFAAVIDQIKHAIECLAKSKYDPDYTLEMQIGSISRRGIVLEFQRWIDLQLACAIGPQTYEGRVIDLRQHDLQDHFPEIHKRLIEKETWMKRVKRSPEKEGRCYIVWSEAMDLSKVTAMVKAATGSLVAFKKPITISGSQKGFFMRASNTADLGNILVRLDGTQSHRSGAVLRVRPWLHYDDYHETIKTNITILKRACLI